MKKESEKIKELKHKSRRYSIQEGMFATLKGSFFDSYVSPFAIAINSSDSLIAMMSAISGLLGPLSQMFSSRLMEKYSRKAIVVKSVLAETLMILPVILIGWLFYKGIIVNSLPLFLLIAFSLYSIFANISGPAWFSWIGDIVDEEYRGRWFAKRSLIHGFLAVVLTFLASVFLDYTKENNHLILGFGILFFLAFVGRIISMEIFKKQYEPKIKLEKGYYFSFFSFLIKSPTNNFGKYSIFRALLAFSGAVFGPFLTIYLLKNLGLNYTIYTIIILAGTVFSLGVMNFWGKFADEYGNYKTMLITSILIPVIPILWVLNDSPVYLILVPSIISGIAWAGFNLSASNFVYDAVTPQRRGIAVSYLNIFIGVGVFLGGALGAFLVKIITFDFIDPLIIIFYFSAVLRMFVISGYLPKFREIRETKKFKGKEAFKNIVLKQARPAIIEGIHEIASIKKYLINP